MTNQLHHPPRPGLLVSVRSATEALAALAGGAAVIDVKEPDRGALGAADDRTIAAVVHVVSRRVPVTAAIGELIDLIGAKRQPLPAGVSLFKIGLAGCRSWRGWRSHWQDAIEASRRDPLSRVPGPGGINPPARGASSFGQALPSPVAVAYADWRSAGAPEPDEVLTAAVEAGCPALLVDTWDKSAGALFHHWPIAPLGNFVQSARSHGLFVVLAGSLAGEDLLAAALLAPNLVGVRTAACDGGRRGIVTAERVRTLQAALRAAAVPVDAGMLDREKIFLDNAANLRILETSSAPRLDGRTFFASRNGGE